MTLIIIDGRIHLGVLHCRFVCYGEIFFEESSKHAMQEDTSKAEVLHAQQECIPMHVPTFHMLKAF